MDRLDALHGQEGRNGKTYWTRIGTAFRSKKGTGYTLYLDYVPVASKEGKVQIALMVPKQRDEAPSRTNSPAASELDDDVPF